MAATIFIAFFVLVVIGVPIAIALGLSAMITLVMHSHVPVMVLVQKAYSGLDTFTLMAIPFFILAGNVMSQGGVSSRLVALASVFFGRYTGGLAQVSTAACTFFGAISGSAPATTAAIGSVMVGPMEAKGYSKEFASACVAASGVIGLLIPPSINMVLYGVITGASIGKMFLGGIVPGLVMSAALMLANYYVAKKHGFMGEAPPSGAQAKKAIRESFFAMLMPVIILGGIYGGVMTATEAAAISVAYAIPCGIFIYKGLKGEGLIDALTESSCTTGVIMVMFFMVMIFSKLLTMQNVPSQIAESLLSITDNKYLILLMVNIFMIIIGMLMDDTSGILLCTPILLPIMKGIGIHPVHFAAILGVNLGMGNITPPTAPMLYLSGRVCGAKINKMLSPTMILIIFAWVPTLILTTYIPALATFLPKLILPKLF